MIPSPLNSKLDLITYRVLVDGNELSAAIEVVQIEVFYGVNRVSSARIDFLDGDPAKELFTLSAGDTFKPGAVLSIQAGYHTEDKEIFSGLIVRQRVYLAPDESPRLGVECRGKEVKMTIGRKSKKYEKKTDSAVITELLSSHGLTPRIMSTAVVSEALIQHYCTDWDFMLTRAEASGMLVIPSPKMVSVSKPSTDATPVLSLTYGESVYKFNLDLDARNQYQAVGGSFWDDLTQQVQQVSAASPGVKAAGKDSLLSLANVVNLKSFTLQSQAPLPTAEAKNWLDSLWVKSALSKIKGTIAFPGSSSISPGDMVQLKGFGSRFDGNAFVAQVQHNLEAGDWSTQLSLGLDEKWFAERQPDVMAPVASGVLPGITGLCSGVVTQTHEDPEQHFRVQVRVPALNDELVWARLAQQQASSATGAFFYPEMKDEVILGFFGGDPRHGVILGSVYSKKQRPAYVPDQANTKKAWVTKQKLTIEFDDEKKIITVKTPGTNQIVFSDESKSITITDQHGNMLEMNQSGISLDSKSAIKLKAATNIELDATGSIDIKADSDLSLKGFNIAGNAQAQLKLEGAVSAQLSAAGQMVVKGATVMIN